MDSNLTGYRGNQNLKRSNVVIEYTEEQIKEYIKCANDPIYFVETYVKVVNIDRGLIPMMLYDFQKRIILSAKDNRRTIAKIGRQAGKSTCIAAFALHQALFNDNYNILIAANKAKTAMEIMKKVQTSYEYLPNWLKQGLGEWNKGTVVFENGSRIMGTSTTADSARGFSFNCVILDEFAFLARNVADEFFTSIYPTISSGKTSKMIVISTPKGMNHFYKMWVEAEEGRSDYVPIEINWWDVPGRDEAFKKEQIRNFGEEKWRQEYECQFLGSSSTLINASKLRELTFKEPLDKINGVTIFERPIEGHSYFIAVDPSEGKGLDNHAFIVADITQKPFNIVATFKNKFMEPLLVPDVLYNIGKIYNDAYTLIETKSSGVQIADILYYDKEYLNLLGAKPNGRSGQILTNYSRNAKGLPTSTSTKGVGCSNLKLLVENDQLISNDFDIVEELTNFVLVNNSAYKADEGYNDDLVMCLVIFAWATTQPFFKNFSEIDVKEILAERKREMEQKFLPFFILDSDEDLYIDDQMIL